MDSISSCRDKLAYFRIKELKDVLNQLGLAKQGKKQDLVDRILGVLSDEQAYKVHGWGKKNSIGKEVVAKIIDDTYRKMQGHGATDLASKSHSSSDLNYLKPKEEVDLDMKVRCLCGSSSTAESVIQCEDPRCQVWQHIGCVIIPEKPLDGVQPEIPPRFYCEICRINRADPFWVTLAHPLLPTKLTSPSPEPDGTTTVQNMEKTFQLTRADRDLLQKNEYDLQVWCTLLNDKVPFRMQWPQYTDLQVNGVPVRTTNRPGSQLLGINGRDDGPAITTCSREGINKISFSRCDARVFCFGIRIARRRTPQQVLNLVPKEQEGECFDDALTRVCRCIGGGAAAENADSDSDLEVVADSFTVNLRCPMSGSRMRIAGRFKPCVHMGCFDLETFVELNQRSRKWQCPICLKNYSLENIIIDPYFNRITSLLQNCGEDVNEIDVKPDGSWRAKNEGECRDLGRWHLPDGSLCAVTGADIKPDPEILKQIKQEGVSEGGTGLKFKRNHNGIWEVSKPEDMRPPSSGNYVAEKYDDNCQKIMPMSSSATGSYRDGEDPSVNQEGGGHFDFSANNVHELDSVSLSFDPTYNADDRMPAGPSKDADVIVLSDSEEDNVTFISPETVYDVGPSDGTGILFSTNHAGVSESYQEDPGLGTNGTSSLGLFGNSDDFEMPIWPPLPTCSQTGPGFQLFNTEVVPDAVADVQHNSLGCPPSLNGYGLASECGTRDASHTQDLTTCRSNTEVNASLVDNPLFGGDDPSLQIFLPTRPPSAPAQADQRELAEMSNGVGTDDWISLRLGAAAGSHGEPTNGLNSRHQFAATEDRMESLANDAASLLLSMNDDRSNRGTSHSQRSDSSFSHPRQPRSVRPRLYLHIDTDSE